MWNGHTNYLIRTDFLSYLSKFNELVMDWPYLPRSTAMAQEEFVHWLYAALADDVTLEPSYT